MKVDPSIYPVLLNESHFTTNDDKAKVTFYSPPKNELSHNSTLSRTADRNFIRKITLSRSLHCEKWRVECFFYWKTNKFSGGFRSVRYSCHTNRRRLRTPSGRSFLTSRRRPTQKWSLPINYSTKCGAFDTMVLVRKTTHRSPGHTTLFRRKFWKISSVSTSQRYKNAS